MYADELLVETVNRLFAEHCTPERIAAAEGGMDTDLWNAISEMGFASVGTAESVGGSGGTPYDAAAIMYAAGYYACPAPVADVLASSLICAHMGLSLADGITVAVAGKRVPWFGVSQHAVTANGIVRATSVDTLSASVNYAGEPYAVVSASMCQWAGEILALARSLQIAGALQRVSELCVQYALEREQFGKPIGKQQILQHYLAQMAGDAAVARAACDNAVDVWSANGFGERFRDAVAGSKTVSSCAVGVTNKNAHQLHGAIGYTDEHRLQLWTRRLWAWRDDFGTEIEWGAHLGNGCIAAGASQLWSNLTRPARP